MPFRSSVALGETPPLTRGRPDDTTDYLVPTGNTPAYAGKTHLRRHLPGPFQKHPRLRGEDRPSSRSLRKGSETPPLTRGRPETATHRRGTKGNTPAYAGKTFFPQGFHLTAQKHPRLRGEDSLVFVPNGKGEETPPLTRGRLYSGVLGAEATGNTPAYAGKTPLNVLFAVMVWKHPRLRGEDLKAAKAFEKLSETPPLTRGRHEARRVVQLSFRNTPAYAGKTTALPSPACSPEKHPRLRGEDRSGRHEVVIANGNTPAYAGKTPGVKDPHKLPLETPPLTRGRPDATCFQALLNRNTPAYAGKTKKFAELLDGIKETPPLTRGRPGG